MDGGEDGLFFYRKISEMWTTKIKKGGILAFEIGFDQGQEVSKIMAELFSDIKVLKDFGGNDRVVTGIIKK